jgi:hypothetical protein
VRGRQDTANTRPDQRVLDLSRVVFQQQLAPLPPSYAIDVTAPARVRTENRLIVGNNAFFFERRSSVSCLSAEVPPEVVSYLAERGAGPLPCVPVVRANPRLLGQACERCLVSPGQPIARVFSGRRRVLEHMGQIVERILTVQFGGVNERSEHVTYGGAVLSAVEERIAPVRDGHLQGTLTDIIFQGRPCRCRKV